MKTTKVDTLSAAFISTYPPRKCGIATFTNDLVQNLTNLAKEGVFRENHLRVAAMKDTPEGYSFPAEVNFEIRDQYREDYKEAAEYLNLSAGDVVSLQHEYGIFGGSDGDHILHMLEHLQKPTVTTLHTVLDNPSPGQKETLGAIMSLSTYTVVLAQKAVEILKNVYGVSGDRVVLIPHGAPDVPFLDTSYYKDQFQAEDRLVLMTFGLLSANKGIEYVIDALPEVVKAFPEVLYVVLGATHPNVKRHEGERYRISLENRVKDLGLERHVIFHNRYVTLERLIQFLVATDIYITPYLSKEQISSGTLAYALGCGKAIISTPYWYAEELLDNGRGILVPFQESKAITKSILELLSNTSKRNRMRKDAYQFGRNMVWREVAKGYDAVFERAVTEFGRRRTNVKLLVGKDKHPSLPEIRIDYMLRLTDDTGIFQHAIYRTPNRFHGYTTDDNARALMVAIMNYKQFNKPDTLQLIQTYLSFLHFALNRDSNRVRNFMSYSRNWLEEQGSEDSHGRTLWSLGYTIQQAPNDAILSLANHLFKQGIKVAMDLVSPRAYAYCILGCLYYIKRFSGDTEVNSMIAALAQRLSKCLSANRTDDWPWFEDSVTYANGRMPQALIAAGLYLNDNKMVSQGIESLDWLVKVQTAPKTGHLTLVGNLGWFKKGGKKALFDQQSVDVLGLLEACLQAYQATADESWKKRIDMCFSWFLGKNDKNECLYDFSTGGCYDGLQRGGLNQNQGAESTVSWLAALHIMYQIIHKVQTKKELSLTHTAA